MQACKPQGGGPCRLPVLALAAEFPTHPPLACATSALDSRSAPSLASISAWAAPSWLWRLAASSSPGPGGRAGCLELLRRAAASPTQPNHQSTSHPSFHTCWPKPALPLPSPSALALPSSSTFCCRLEICSA